MNKQAKKPVPRKKANKKIRVVNIRPGLWAEEKSVNRYEIKRKKTTKGS